jgi:hypothetical protein
LPAFNTAADEKINAEGRHRGPGGYGKTRL